MKNSRLKATDKPDKLSSILYSIQKSFYALIFNFKNQIINIFFISKCISK